MRYRTTTRSGPAIQRGTQSTGTFSAANTDKDVAVTFPVPFAAAPAVYPAAVASSSQNIRYPVTVVSTSTTGCVLNASRAVGTGAFDISWIAVL